MPRSKHRRKGQKKARYNPGRKRPGTRKKKEEDSTVLVQGDDPDNPVIEVNKRNRYFFYVVAGAIGLFVIVVILRIFGVL